MSKSDTDVRVPHVILEQLRSLAFDNRYFAVPSKLSLPNETDYLYVVLQRCLDAQPGEPFPRIPRSLVEQAKIHANDSRVCAVVSPMSPSGKESLGEVLMKCWDGQCDAFMSSSPPEDSCPDDTSPSTARPRC